MFDTVIDHADVSFFFKYQQSLSGHSYVVSKKKIGVYVFVLAASYELFQVVDKCSSQRRIYVLCKYICTYVHLIHILENEMKSF